jgi:hypothetical protein
MILPSKKSFDYDYTWLREMENEHLNIYFDSLRRDRLRKDVVIEDKMKNGMKISKSSKNKEKEIIHNHHLNPRSFKSSFDANSNQKIIQPEYIENQNLKINFQKNEDNLSQNVEYENKKFNTFNIDQNFDYTFEFFISEIFNLLSIDQEIENIRISLSHNDNFNLISIFNFFDKNKEDYITFENFVNELEFFNIYLYPEYMRDAELIFRRFDKTENNKIK